MTSRQGTDGTRCVAGSDRSRSAERGELARSVELALGVAVTWGPDRPHDCLDVTVSDDRDPTDDDTRPWLRLAAVIVLDRQLHLPLDRSLLDAEHAAACMNAARTLSHDDPLREHLVRRALVGARAASGGVVAVLDRLAADDRCRPAVLDTALGGLVRGYASLCDEVREFDSVLAAVVEAGQRLINSAPGSITPDVLTPGLVVSSRRGVDRIDPRSVPARVLRFGPTCDAAEIDVVPVAGNGGPAVRVRVDAFSAATPPDHRVDVGVQLVDRRSGAVRGRGILGSPTARGEKRYLEAVLPLPGSMSAVDVRADVFDAAAPPPAPAEDDELRRVRRATLFLADWRALVADARLLGPRSTPTARLPEILRRLDADTADDEVPLWSGGPTRSGLRRLGEQDDRSLTTWLSDGHAPGTAADDERGPIVSGPGDLLVAELVAAHDRLRG